MTCMQHHKYLPGYFGHTDYRGHVIRGGPEREVGEEKINTKELIGIGQHRISSA